MCGESKIGFVLNKRVDGWMGKWVDGRRDFRFSVFNCRFGSFDPFDYFDIDQDRFAGQVYDSFLIPFDFAQGRPPFSALCS